MWGTLKGIGHSVTASMSPQAFIKYKQFFSMSKLPYEILFDNLETLFQEEQISMGKRAGGIIGKYARYNEIQNFIDDIVRSNQDIASSYIAGKTYEKRDLKVVVLKTDKSKRSIWLDCGIHAVILIFLEFFLLLKQNFLLLKNLSHILFIIIVCLQIHFIQNDFNIILYYFLARMGLTLNLYLFY